MDINPLSQRDSTLKDKKLGTSNLLIWDYGCVVTCLTMLINYATGRKYTVDTVNQLLIANGGFYDNSLLWWTEVYKAFPFLKFSWRAWTYDNTSVVDYVNNRKIPVIVQVDAAPIGAPRSDHYVLFKGGGQLIDPWDGKVKPTSTYPNLKGYILYEIDRSKITENTQETVESLQQKVNDLQQTEKRLREEWIKKESDMRVEFDKRLKEVENKKLDDVINYAQSLR